MPKGSRVLMADDDKMLIDMYKERLELAGYGITICRNGEEALAKTREIKPDIVLLDVMMPKINGYESLAALKSDPETKDIPIIMLSALMRDFNREKAVEAGADDYLIKSEAMPADVITKIEQVLQKYGKGVSPVPGTQAPNIVAPSATPPPMPVAPLPVSVANPAYTATPIATPPAEVMQGGENVFEPVPPIATPVVAPSQTTLPTPQVIPPAPVVAQSQVATPEVAIPQAQPTQMAEPKEEEVPVIKLEPNKSEKLPQMPWEMGPPENVKEEKKPASVVLIVVLVILLTALINDVIIYYFFIMNK